jgi:tetratricopeptide (TPR) repeat protein
MLAYHEGPSVLATPGSATPAFVLGDGSVNEAVADPLAIQKPIRSQQQQAARATRHLELAHLVNKIHFAIQADDVQMTSKLLKKLANFKGPKHPFVSKLKAYSLIRQERLEEAKPLLDRVLAQNVDDLEAGLNMSVIEIKTGLYDDARRRLEKLQELYPEQDQVSFYLKQLPR